MTRKKSVGLRKTCWKKEKRVQEIRGPLSTKRTRVNAKDQRRSECLRLHRTLFGRHNTGRPGSSGSSGIQPVSSSHGLLCCTCLDVWSIPEVTYCGEWGERSVSNLLIADWSLNGAAPSSCRATWVMLPVWHVDEIIGRTIHWRRFWTLTLLINTAGRFYLRHSKNWINPEQTEHYLLFVCARVRSRASVMSAALFINPPTGRLKSCRCVCLTVQSYTTFFFFTFIGDSKFCKRILAFRKIHQIRKKKLKKYLNLHCISFHVRIWFQPMHSDSQGIFMPDTASNEMASFLKNSSPTPQWTSGYRKPAGPSMTWQTRLSFAIFK